MARKKILRALSFPPTTSISYAMYNRHISTEWVPVCLSMAAMPRSNRLRTRGRAPGRAISAATATSQKRGEEDRGLRGRQVGGRNDGWGEGVRVKQTKNAGIRCEEARRGEEECLTCPYERTCPYEMACGL